MSSEGISALVLGGTGAIGKEVLQELISNPKFSRVTVITRRNIEGLDYPKVQQELVDFDQLDSTKTAFDGAQVAFCCLGTTREKSGIDGFKKVDRDYVHSSAKLLKEAGCSHFHLVTAKGANKRSPFLYPQIKGEVESMVEDLNFERLSIYRPGLLLCEREETRIFEKFAQVVAKGFDWRNKFSIAVDTVAHAMITNTFLPTKANVEVFEHGQINAVGID